jgi:hypothetical protein
MSKFLFEFLLRELEKAMKSKTKQTKLGEGGKPNEQKQTTTSANKRTLVVLTAIPTDLTERVH